MEAVYEKLRPGPGRSAPDVSSHQRTRLRGAMIEIAAEHGYGAVTVRRLARLAGVSTRSFYQQFGEKETCFLSAYERIVRLAARRAVESSQGAGGDWGERLRLGLWTLARELAAEPKAARLVLVEAFAVGPMASEQMANAEAIFEAVVRASLAQAPERAAVPPPVVRAIVAGATRVARARLLSGRAEELPALVDELVEWALCLIRATTPLEERPDRQEMRPLFAIPELDPKEGRRGPVPGDEQTLAMAAVARLAASRGYETLSAPQIRLAAGVSRKSFDAHFADVEGGFLAAVGQIGADAVTDAAREGAGAETWPAGVHRAVSALCRRIARDPAFSRLAFVEILAPGPNGLRHRERLVAEVAAGLRNSAPSGQRPDELAAEASVGAAWDAIHHQVAAGRASQMPRQAPMLTFLLLAPTIGGGAATKAIRTEDERIGEIQCRGV